MDIWVAQNTQMNPLTSSVVSLKTQEFTSAPERAYTHTHTHTHTCMCTSGSPQVESFNELR